MACACGGGNRRATQKVTPSRVSTRTSRSVSVPARSGMPQRRSIIRTR